MAANRDMQDDSEAAGQENEFARARLVLESGRYEEALSIYLRLAETQSGSRIYVRIGWMYEFGMGTKKDARQAERWYERAANTGIPAGYYWLAGMRCREGRNADVREPMERAAEQGYSPALFHLGQMYEFGKGVPVDRSKAYDYYEEAAARGHLFAQRAIAQKFIRGEHGLWRIPKGFFMVARTIWNAVKLQWKDPHNDRLQRLA